jgi:hypothetical protein
MRGKIGLVLAVGFVLPLAVAASASAQGARLTVTPSTARVGDTVNVTGAAFNPSNANVAGGVDIRLNTRDGEPLANALPTPQNTISASFVVPPSVTPGEYLVIATQTSVRGRHTFGGPGRAKLRVVAAAGAAPPGRFPFAGAPPAAVAGTLLALILLAGGTTLAVRRLRTPNRPLGS